VQLKRTLRCDKISLYLAEDEGFEQMICEGQTVLQDGASGDTVTGERAVYQPGSRRVRVEGSPVTLRDAQGTEIQGRVLIYDFGTATARVETEPPGSSSQAENP
jgi:lipopolysaccharide export system protein LptA